MSPLFAHNQFDFTMKRLTSTQPILLEMNQSLRLLRLPFHKQNVYLIRTMCAISFTKSPLILLPELPDSLSKLCRSLITNLFDELFSREVGNIMMEKAGRGTDSLLSARHRTISCALHGEDRWAQKRRCSSGCLLEWMA